MEVEGVGGGCYEGGEEEGGEHCEGWMSLVWCVMRCTAVFWLMGYLDTCEQA